MVGEGDDVRVSTATEIRRRAACSEAQENLRRWKPYAPVIIFGMRRAELPAHLGV
jgi:hypothetical protein